MNTRSINPKETECWNALKFINLFFSLFFSYVLWAFYNTYCFRFYLFKTCIFYFCFYSYYSSLISSTFYSVKQFCFYYETKKMKINDKLSIWMRKHYLHRLLLFAECSDIIFASVHNSKTHSINLQWLRRLLCNSLASNKKFVM